MNRERLKDEKMVERPKGIKIIAADVTGRGLRHYSCIMV